MENHQTENGLIQFLKNLSLPDWIANNVITALGKGIHGIVTEASEIPKAHLRNHSERIKLIGEIKRDWVRKAAGHPLQKIENEPDLANRALESYGIKLLEEQLNKEAVAGKTIEQLRILPIPEIYDEKTISHDWLTSFWNLVGTKSEDEIQEILSKILANEIVQPGSLSLHTLQTLSILDSKAGNSFAKLCNLSIDDGRTAFVIHTNVFHFQNIGDIDDYGITLNDLLYLDGANLIRSAETLLVNYAQSETHEDGKFDYEIVDYASKRAKLDVSGQQLHLIIFTQAGRELRRLITMESVKSYTEVLKKRLGDNFIVTG